MRWPDAPVVLVIAALSVAPSPVLAAEAPVRAVVLGVAQDGGVPHIGCAREPCVSARRDHSLRRRVASLGLVDERSGRRFIIDATPDLASQIESLNEGRAAVERQRPVDGILLTHAHVGHYAGLMYLGREALGARGVPVLATPRMARFLRENGPWSQLVALGNIELREIEPGVEVALTPALRVTPLRVPHRDEFSDTMGYVVRGPSAALLYVPDIDRWETWERRLEDEVAEVDHALLDATFLREDEQPGRSRSEIPHPLVSETMARLANVARRVAFVHLNHTNPLLFDPGAVAEIEGRGFRVARDGERLPLEAAR
ncbi:MAG TPA: MBL fold metallo-hydrolase [Vicinamibacteria bacterium]|nr:MBL fold metallo-hydrolase [Vicinamibacteria bacterium]